MTPQQFRKLALSHPGVTEASHGGHPDFRSGGKVFASLGSPDAASAMVKLTPLQQASFLQAAADIFRPSNGAWGERGYTNVLLKSADHAMVRSAIALAWENVQPKKRTK